MPQGSFNVQRLTAELGLKNVSEMPVGLALAATVPLETMAGMVPVHQSPQAMFGGTTGLAVGEFSAAEFTCLDPGGAYLEVFQQSGVTITINLTTGAAPLVFAAVGPLAHPAQQFQVDPVLSTVVSGTILAAPVLTTPQLLDIWAPYKHPLWVERGRRIVFTALNANTAFRFYLTAMAISATQAEE